MISIKLFVFNPFMENTYVISDETKEAIIVDPGCYEKQEQAMLSNFIEEEGLKVVKLINTHCHVDHVLGNHFVKTKYKVPLIIHPEDEPVLESVKVYAPNYGFSNYQATTPDGYMKEAEDISFGESKLSVIFVPGHAPGHVALYHQESNQVISGDVLFRQSIGRTDLPGGDFNTLIQSIRTKMFALPDDCTVYPGHGGETTIGYEKVHNPFLNQ